MTPSPEYLIRATREEFYALHRLVTAGEIYAAEKKQICEKLLRDPPDRGMQAAIASWNDTLAAVPLAKAALKRLSVNFNPEIKP